MEQIMPSWDCASTPRAMVSSTARSGAPVAMSSSAFFSDSSSSSIRLASVTSTPWTRMPATVPSASRIGW